MSENTSQSREERRRVWDADYRAKNRDRRREYDRERMRAKREQEREAS